MAVTQDRKKLGSKIFSRLFLLHLADKMVITKGSKQVGYKISCNDGTGMWLNGREWFGVQGSRQREDFAVDNGYYPIRNAFYITFFFNPLKEG